MTDVDVKKLLNPTGAAIQDAVQGAWSTARVAVAVYWDEIEAALQAGVPVSAIYRALRKAGLVTVTRQAFTRQVKARREGTKGVRSAAKPATDARPSEVILGRGAAPRQEEPAAEVKRPGIPDRPWRKGPHIPPDPNLVFRPRDPLADD